MKLDRIFISAFLSACIAACSNAPSDVCREEATGVDQAKIIKGTEATSADFDGVLRASNGGSCTVARVSETHLLTAAHCFETTVAGDSLKISRSKGDASFSKTFTVKSRTAHPSYDSSLPYSEEFDVAIIELTESLGGDIALSAIDTLPVTLDEKLTLVGYGCDAFADDAGSGSGTRRIGVVPVSKLYEGVLQMSGPSYVCPGDSGGPAFRGGDIKRVVGVISSGDFRKATGPTHSNLARLENIDAWLRSFGLAMYNAVPPPKADAGAAVPTSMGTGTGGPKRDTTARPSEPDAGLANAAHPLVSKPRCQNGVLVN